MVSGLIWQMSPQLHQRPLRVNRNARLPVVNHCSRPINHPLIPLNLRHYLTLHFQRRQGNFETLPIL